jgi:hypothetical protein
MGAISASTPAATNTIPVTELGIMADTATLIIAATIGRAIVITERAPQVHRGAPLPIELKTRSGPLRTL